MPSDIISSIFQDTRIADLRTQILAMANREALDPAELTLALADTLAAVAATLDLDPGQPRMALDLRLDVFIEHVRARHPVIKHEMALRRKVVLSKVSE